MEDRFYKLFTRAQKLESSTFHGWLCHAYGAFSLNADENEYLVISRYLEKLERTREEKPEDEEEEA